MAELSPEEKDEISHRGRAMRALSSGCPRGCDRRARSPRRATAAVAGGVLNTPLVAPGRRQGVDEVRRGAAVDRLELDPDRAEGRRRRGHGIDRDHHRGGPLQHRPARVDRRLSVAAQGRRARGRGAPVRARQGREPRGRDRGHADPRRRRGDRVRGVAAARRSAASREPRLRHRRDRGLGGREPRRLHLPLPAGARTRLARARGRRGAPARRRGDLARRAARARADRGDRLRAGRTRSSP